MEPVPLALIVYSAQILAVLCAAALGVALLRESGPSVRLAYWRVVGALCLALPLLASTPADRMGLSVVFASATVDPGGRVAAEPALVTTGAVILWTWLGGTVARLLWLLAGAWGLRRLRRQSAPALLGAEIDALRKTLAPHAELRWSSELKQPVTFGIWRPVVLLPARFGELGADAQRAVACHELLHVSRRDWMWIVLEEHVRALFWVHPGVWWLVEQVQLAREQVIDQLVVSSAVSKRTYMTALMTFADGGRVAPLSIAFLRRRHLKARFRQLSMESHMSFRRLVWTTTALALVMGSVAFGSARALPLDLGALTQQSRAGARLEIRLAETEPAAGLTGAALSGSDRRIYLHPTVLATDADVTSARVIDMGGSQFGVVVRFSGSASARMASGTAAHLGRPVAIVIDGKVIAAPTLRAPISDSAMLTGITADSAQELATRLSPVIPAQNGVVRVGITLPSPIYEERPQYTQAAMAARIEGSVLLEAVVLTDGSVGEVSVIDSLDSEFGLDQQAVNALKLWTFKPGTRDGEPVRVAVHVLLTFTLK